MKTLLTFSTLITVLLILYCTTANGQNNKRVTSSHGVDFSTVTILFRDSSELTAAVSLYDLFNHNIFRFSSKEQVAVDLGIVQSVTIDSTIYHIKNATGRPGDFVLAQLVIDGKLKLYSSRKNDITEYYAEKDEIFKQLRSYRKSINGTQSLLIEEYKSILKFLMLDCPSVYQEWIDDLEFSFKHLSEIVSQYNGYCGWQNKINDVTYQKDQSVFIRSAIVAGISVARYSVYNNFKSRVAPGPVSEILTNRPFVGVSINVAPKSLGGISFTNILTLEIMDGASTRKYFVAPYIINEVVINYRMLKIRSHLLIQYRVFRKRKFSFDAGAGCVVDLNVSDRSTYSKVTVDRTRYPNEKITRYSEKLTAKPITVSPVPSVFLEIGSFQIGYHHLMKAAVQKKVEQSANEYRVSLTYKLGEAKVTQQL